MLNKLTRALSAPPKPIELIRKKTFLKIPVTDNSNINGNFRNVSKMEKDSWVADHCAVLHEMFPNVESAFLISRYGSSFLVIFIHPYIFFLTSNQNFFQFNKCAPLKLNPLIEKLYYAVDFGYLNFIYASLFSQIFE